MQLSSCCFFAPLFTPDLINTTRQKRSGKIIVCRMNNSTRRNVIFNLPIICNKILVEVICLSLVCLSVCPFV